MTTDVLLEMPLDRTGFIRRVESKADQLNEHLIKLLAFQAPEDMRTHWKREVTNWCRQLTGVRIMRPKGAKGRSPRPEEFMEHLFKPYFGLPVEAARVDRIAQNITDEYPSLSRNDKSAAQVRDELRLFWGNITPSMCGNTLNVSLIQNL